MADFEEVQEKKNTDSTKSLDEALVNAEQRQEETAEPPVRESQSQNFFVRFLNFITGRSRRRPGRAGAARNVEVAETMASQQEAGVNEEVASTQQASQDAAQAVDPAVRDELIQNKRDYLNRRFIEFVDAQPIVKILVKRNIMSLTLCFAGADLQGI